MSLFVDDECVVALRAQLHAEEVLAQDVSTFFKCHGCRASVAVSDDVYLPQKIWTDGASSNNQDSGFSRAGSGVYYGRNHSMNMHVMLPGLVQTNQRAELLAIVLALNRDPRKLGVENG